MIQVPIRTLRDQLSFLFSFLFQHSTAPTMPCDRGKVQMSGFFSRCSFAKDKTLDFVFPGAGTEPTGIQVALSSYSNPLIESECLGGGTGLL